MNRELQAYSVNELRDQLNNETRAFLNELDNESNLAALKEIRARIKEVIKMLELKLKAEKMQ
ncbi:MAG: hypothetical protein ABUT20_40300 [Bacteroidota bacterium]